MNTETQKINEHKLFRVANFRTSDAFATFGILIFISAILYFSGALTSGYHLIDDHYIYESRESVSNIGFWPSLQAWLQQDLQSRTRPVFIFLHVTESYLFDSIEARAVASLCWLLLTTLLAYLLLRRLGFSVVYASALVLLIFIGRQTSAWVMLGTQERYGMLFMLLCLWFALLAAQASRWRWAYDILFVSALWLTAFSKESFLLLVPLLVIIRLGLPPCLGKKSLLETIRQSSPMLLLAFVMIGGTFLYCWQRLLSVNAGYAGIGGFTVADFLYHFFDGYFRYKLSIAPFIILLLVLLYAKRHIPHHQQVKIFNVEMSIYSLITLLFVVLGYAPQVFIYTQSGFVGRYFMPAEFFFWLAVALPFVGMQFIETVHIQKLVKGVALTIFVVLMVVGVSHAWHESVLYGQEGKNLKAFFGQIDKATANNPKFLFVVQPDTRDYEKSQAVKTFYDVVVDKPIAIKFCPLVMPAHPAGSFDNQLLHSFFATQPVALPSDSTVKQYDTLVFLEIQDTTALKNKAPAFKPHNYAISIFEKHAVLQRTQ